MTDKTNIDTLADELRPCLLQREALAIDVRDLALDLQHIAKALIKEARKHPGTRLGELPDVDSTDVRLVMSADGVPVLLDGPVDYDTEHGVACAAGTVTFGHAYETAALTLACELCNELLDQIACLPDDEGEIGGVL